jgi:DNA-cytosine methyltransferase
MAVHPTCATLFSGGGLADIGLKAAGLTPLWAVEYDAEIAAVYAANHGDHVIVGDVRGVNFATLPAPDLLWASPPCPSFSVAKTGRGETATDLEIAGAVARAIRTLRPRCFVLENVEGYVHSKSYRLIRAALDGLDYWSDAEVVNAADMGVPQTRRRLILRARAGGWMQPSRPWPAPLPWVGWYAAIEDLIPTLPESAFAPWQLKRLPKEIRESVLVEGTGNQWNSEAASVTVARSDEPVGTIRAAHYKGIHRALIVGGSNTSDGKAAQGVGVSEAGEPVRAVPADISPSRYRAVLYSNAATMDERDGGGADNRAAHRAALPSGRVVAMTPRALARFQGVPDSYVLPAKKALACRVLGNGVCPEVARVAALTLLEEAT